MHENGELRQDPTAERGDFEAARRMRVGGRYRGQSEGEWEGRVVDSLGEWEVSRLSE